MQITIKFKTVLIVALIFNFIFIGLAQAGEVKDKEREKFSFAINHNEIIKVKTFMGKGFGPNTRFPDQDNQTALAWSMRSKDETFFLLLENGGDPNLKSDEGDSAFTWAVSGGNAKRVEVMLKKGANPNDVIPFGRDNPKPVLIVAITRMHKGVVKALVKAGADVNIKDSSGKTPLFWAKDLNWKDGIQLLKSHGAKE